MKTTLIGLILLCGFGLFGVAFTGSLGQKQKINPRLPGDENDPTTIKGKIKRAKEKGDRRITIGTDIPLLVEVSNPMEASAEYSVVMVKPVDKTSMVIDSGNISTFYKVEVVEMLTQGKPCSICFPEIMPDGLPVLSDNEMYILVGGGTVTMDKIEIYQEEQFGGFDMSEQYLLFLAHDPSKRIGMVTIGAGGIYHIRPDGSLKAVIDPIHPGKNSFQLEVEQRGQSIDRFKAAIKSYKQKQ